MGKSKFTPPSKSAFDPIKKSAFDPVKKSKWTPRKKPTPTIEVEYVQCGDCSKPVRSEVDRPLCSACVDKLKQELVILKNLVSQLSPDGACPRCGYPDDDE